MMDPGAARLRRLSGMTRCVEGVVSARKRAAASDGRAGRSKSGREVAQTTTTFVPFGTLLNRSITSMLRIRMQPDEAERPIVSGSLVPWMR